jgi:Spy/CpxP family protein refolding chaperone
MSKTIAGLCLLLIGGLALQPALAQFGAGQGPAEARGRRGYSLLGGLVAPNVVMAHAAVIGLTDGQREVIIRAMQETQTSMVPIEWTLRGETHKLRDLLDAPLIDENAALNQAGRIAELEGRMKRLHLRLLIRMKNHLTIQQQEALRTIVHERLYEGPAFGRGLGPPGPEIPFN